MYTRCRLIQEVRRECDQGNTYVSSDEEESTNQMTDVTVVTDNEFRQMLQMHRLRRKANDVSIIIITSDIITSVMRCVGLLQTSLEQAVRGLETKQTVDFSRGESIAVPD